MEETVAAPPPAIRAPRLVTAAAVSVALSELLNAAGVFSEEEIHWVNLLLGLVIASVAALVVFGLFARRAARRPASAWRVGLVFGALALLTVPAFWSGLPPVFGGAAVYLGLVSDARGMKRTGLAAVALGALAIVLDITAYASDVASRL